MPTYPSEQLWPLYNNLPKDLQEAVFSEESARNIYNACAQNSITDNGIILEITKQVGYALLGLLSPNDFPGILEKELQIKKNIAEQVSARINNSIFLPVKNSLGALYGIEINLAPVAEVQKNPSQDEENAEKSEKEKSKREKTMKKDPYQEKVE